MAKERTLDIFNVLSAIDRKQYDLWDTLTDEQRKEFSPLVAMRWMAGCDDPFQVIMVNELVNMSVFQLGDQHKEFLLRLMSVASSGRTKRYKWVNYKLTAGTKVKRAVELVATHYNMSLKDAQDSVRLFSIAELTELAEGAGWQKDEIKALQKEAS